MEFWRATPSITTLAAAKAAADGIEAIQRQSITGCALQHLHAGR
jgi:hypothetical protein